MSLQVNWRACKHWASRGILEFAQYGFVAYQPSRSRFALGELTDVEEHPDEELV